VAAGATTVDVGAAENSIPEPSQGRVMPPTKEVKCLDEDCYMDLFENHYTYDVPDDHSVGDLACPVCGGTNLEEVEL